uniref:Uncharacterized protein n=1 Tax=Peronospora matthiolae TaxID=2874970 RepID=A0AAV1TRR9_9STRA
MGDAEPKAHDADRASLPSAFSSSTGDTKTAMLGSLVARWKSTPSHPQAHYVLSVQVDTFACSPPLPMLTGED